MGNFSMNEKNLVSDVTFFFSLILYEIREGHDSIRKWLTFVFLVLVQW